MHADGGVEEWIFVGEGEHGGLVGDFLGGIGHDEGLLHARRLESGDGLGQVVGEGGVCDMAMGVENLHGCLLVNGNRLAWDSRGGCVFGGTLRLLENGKFIFHFQDRTRVSVRARLGHAGRGALDFGGIITLGIWIRARGYGGYGGDGGYAGRCPDQQGLCP